MSSHCFGFMLRFTLCRFMHHWRVCMHAGVSESLCHGPFSDHLRMPFHCLGVHAQMPCVYIRIVFDSHTRVFHIVIICHTGHDHYPHPRRVLTAMSQRCPITGLEQRGTAPPSLPAFADSLAVTTLARIIVTLQLQCVRHMPSLAHATYVSHCIQLLRATCRHMPP